MATAGKLLNESNMIKLNTEINCFFVTIVQYSKKTRPPEGKQLNIIKKVRCKTKCNFQ